MGDHAREAPEEALESSVLDVICGLLAHTQQRRPLLALLGGLDLIKAGFYSNSQQISTLEDQTQLLTVLGQQEADLLSKVNTDEDTTTSSSTLRERSTSMSTQSTTFSEDVTEYDEEEDLWTAKLSASRVPEVTALHLAASMGLARVAALLLEQTPHIDAIDVTGRTALAVAMERGFEKAVELLVNSGASVDISRDSGRMVLLVVAERDWRSVGDRIAANARAAMGNDDLEISFILAAYYCDDRALEKVYQDACLKGAQAQCEAHFGLSLFFAIGGDSAPTVKTLLALGANINAEDSSGQTSLHRATRRGNRSMMSVLIESQAEIDRKDHDGRTPWSSNIRNQNQEVLATLLEAGADVNTQGLQGVSELYTASKAGEARVVKYMLQCGTDPDIATDYDWRSIHWAACDGFADVVRLLLDHGADPNVTSDQDVTPLDLCIRKGQDAMVTLLKEAGAKDSKDLFPPTPRPEATEAQEDDWVQVTKALNQVTMFNPDQMILVFDNPLARTMINPLFVGQYIFPRSTTGPQPYTYHIDHVLDAISDTLSIRRAAQRAEMWEYPLGPEAFDRRSVMYDIVRPRRDAQNFELHAAGDEAISDDVHMIRDWTGGWKVFKSSDVQNTDLLRSTPDYARIDGEACRWMIPGEVTNARTGWDDQAPFLSFTSAAADRRLQDLLVTCWVIKLWSETSSASSA